MNLILSSVDTDDMQFLHRNQVLNDLLRTAREIIQNGGQVIIQSEYDNAPPDIVRVFATLADLDGWENEIAQATRRANAFRSSHTPKTS
jgi:hypothetical protein